MLKNLANYYYERERAGEKVEEYFKVFFEVPTPTNTELQLPHRPRNKVDLRLRSQIGDQRISWCRQENQGIRQGQRGRYPRLACL